MTATATTTIAVLAEIAAERDRQDAKWGEQNHPDGTGAHDADSWLARAMQAETDRAAREGTLTWRHILGEELAEAYAETDWPRLREELVQVAAVVAAWIECGDRRAATT